MARKTHGVYDLVQSVLQTLPEPYGEDVIEDVFVAIDRDMRNLSAQKYQFDR